MKAPPSTLSTEKTARARREIRGPEIGPALKRDRLLQRVQAARKRLTPEASDTVARLR
jgi:hypothetical protein